jgi:simple sugar transport system substrate-binding protein/ribose transport system substrate-binding protein
MLAFGIVAAMGVSACNGSSSSASGGSHPLVGVDYPRSDSDFWNSYQRYVPQYASQDKLDLKATSSQNDIAKLAANAQALMAQGVKGMVIAPQDTAAVAPTLAQLKARHIPVVSVDTRPDTGDVYMVVRADNKAYGTKACQYLGTRLKGKGKVAMLEGDLTSINGRDRTDAFNTCMKSGYPGITVIGLPTNWDGAVAANKLQTTLAANPDLNGIYMQAGGVFLAPTLQVLKQKNMLLPATDPKHVVIVSNDGIPQEMKAIESGQIDATVSQPADLYAKYALYYVQAAIQGKTFKPGPTDHDSTIVQVRQGVLEDQLPAPLVTLDGSYPGSTKATDPGLWANQIH